MKHIIEPIGVIHSPYKEKFAIPRQPNLVPAGNGELHLFAPYNNPDIVRGLEQFSHIWLLFMFHQTTQRGWKATVRPPRLGGNQRIGVFASRSTFRPNNIGMSAVELHGIVYQKNKIILKLGSLDLLDGTPVIDIKPYISYSDSYPNAKAGYAQHAPTEKLIVNFDIQAIQQLTTLAKTYKNLQALIEQVISQDPRPAYKAKQRDEYQEYAMKLFDINIKWIVYNETVTVTELSAQT